MKDQNKKHVKRVRKMIVVCALCAIILTVSTYAWFIGMKTVNVSSFDVEIAAIDGLSLSLNGSAFSDTVSINSTNFNDTLSANGVYAGNTNSWGNGLIPISTVGKIDSATSRMIMYEKGSLTATPGGYRLMASKIENEGASEKNGYVAFDLFVKNLSGTEYYKNLDKLNEEAIYLTIDSEVVASTNGGVQNTGIENSVRVAFAQIGRVKADSSASAITGITCNADNNASAESGYNADVTGICANRDAQIWEPNDDKHVQNAINWYNTSCLKRTAQDLTQAASYTAHNASKPEDNCGVVENGHSYETYAVSGVIDYSDYVDVYDGTDYNKYTSSVAPTAADGKLVAYNYFTDTMKNKSGVSRPDFITLAPNSVTKIRVYVYIEGQDVDNYDFASLGKKINVKFGFTKERFFDEDVSYDSTNTATLPSDVIKSQHVSASE